MKRLPQDTQVKIYSILKEKEIYSVLNDLQFYTSEQLGYSSSLPLNPKFYVCIVILPKFIKGNGMATKMLKITIMKYYCLPGATLLLKLLCNLIIFKVLKSFKTLLSILPPISQIYLASPNLLP